MLAILFGVEIGDVHWNLALERWKNYCIPAAVQATEIPQRLCSDLAARSALIDLIAFCPGWFDDAFISWSLEIIDEIRTLPESCCMFDGRKWKRIPFVVLHDTMGVSSTDALWQAGVPVIPHLPEEHGDRAFQMTIDRLREIVDEYQKRVLAEFEKAGILVAYEHGRFRVRWALRKKNLYAESEYYYAGSDRRKLNNYVTVYRETAGIAHDAQIFEQLINNPDTRERELQKFLEENPAFLMDAMQGVPIAHKPRFASPPGQTPDFLIPPVAALNEERPVKVVELKGVHEQLLTGRLHRTFSHGVYRAIAQVRDYALHLEQHALDNRGPILQALGYLPNKAKKAVVIGRSPTTESDRVLRNTRAGDELEVSIVTYDEILQSQQEQL